MSPGGRARRQRSGGLGLWRWTPSGIEPERDPDNPCRRPCPTCRASPGQPCTRPAARGGRRTMRGYHPSRTERTEP